MFVLKSAIFFILVIIVGAQSENITFVDIRVFGYEVGDPVNLKRVPITSASNLNQVPEVLNLQTIDEIRGPSLHTLREDSVTDLPNLRTFRKTFGSLAHMEPGAFKNLSNLETLIVIFSKLAEVREGVFNNLPIKTLYLHGNDISKIDTRAFDNMTKLQVLSLYSNKLTQWDKNWFYNVPKLTHLYFSNNKFEELPENAFKNLKNLRGMVSFRFCGIRRLGNNLFGGNKKVGVLDLSYNKVKVFGDRVLDGVEEMEKLVLSSNNIWCFSGVLDRIFVAKLTEVHNNPLACDGSCLKSITEWEAEGTNGLKVRKVDHTCVH